MVINVDEAVIVIIILLIVMHFIDAVSLCCSCEHLGEMVNFPSPSGRA